MSLDHWSFAPRGHSSNDDCTRRSFVSLALWNLDSTPPRVHDEVFGGPRTAQAYVEYEWIERVCGRGPGGGTTGPRPLVLSGDIANALPNERSVYRTKPRNAAPCSAAWRAASASSLKCWFSSSSGVPSRSRPRSGS